MVKDVGEYQLDAHKFGSDAEEWCITGALLLSRASRLWELALETTLKQDGLLPAEMRVLAALLSGDQDGLTMGQIKQSVAVTAGGVTKAVDRLKRVGLVSKQTSKEDARVTLVLLTAEGRQRAIAALADVFALFGERFRDLDSSKRSALPQLLGSLVIALESKTSG